MKEFAQHANRWMHFSNEKRFLQLDQASRSFSKMLGASLAYRCFSFVARLKTEINQNKLLVFEVC